MTKYEFIIEKIAKDNNTTTFEVENEMKLAVKAAGFDVEPNVFITLCAAKTKSDMKRAKLKKNTQ